MDDNLLTCGWTRGAKRKAGEVGSLGGEAEPCGRRIDMEGQEREESFPAAHIGVFFADKQGELGGIP